MSYLTKAFLFMAVSTALLGNEPRTKDLEELATLIIAGVCLVFCGRYLWMSFVEDRQ